MSKREYYFGRRSSDEDDDEVSGFFRVFRNMTPLEPSVHRHVRNVYRTLMTALGCTAVGAAGQVWTGNAVPPLLAFILSLAAMWWFFSIPYAMGRHSRRVTALHTAALAQGLAVGPMVSYGLMMSDAVVAMAIAATATVFACFSLAALFASRRSYLYLGGILGSAMSVLFWAGMIGLLYPTQMGFSLQLYLGLLVFAGFVAYDTQMVVERAHEGDRDYLRHAFELFTDFMALFRRILIILMRNQQRDDRRKSRRY